jgi:hypothetical protein
MAGSYNHAVTKNGNLRGPDTMEVATETQGDAYETIEEMYGMIWYLAHRLVDILPTEDPRDVVEEARQGYEGGLIYAREVNRG